MPPRKPRAIQRSRQAAHHRLDSRPELLAVRHRQPPGTQLPGTRRSRRPVSRPRPGRHRLAVRPLRGLPGRRYQAGSRGIRLRRWRPLGSRRLLRIQPASRRQPRRDSPALAAMRRMARIQQIQQIQILPLLRIQRRRRSLLHRERPRPVIRPRRPMRHGPRPRLQSSRSISRRQGSLRLLRRAASRPPRFPCRIRHRRWT